MEISDELYCLFAGRVEDHGDSYHIEVPKREVKLGAIDVGEPYRVAVLPTRTNLDSKLSAGHSIDEGTDQPPVDEGDTREVEIDSLGDKGDGIARVDRGYVLIVPETDVGEQVTVRIEETKQNVAFAEVIKQHHDF